MPSNVDHESVSSIASMRGDDDDETRLLREHLQEARAFVESHTWGRHISDAYFGGGVGGIAAVFLFDLGPSAEADEWIWVVVGNLPSAYLVTDQSPTPKEALAAYCELMESWAKAVLNSGDLSDEYPVAAKATVANAENLLGRIQFVRKNVFDRL